jgi:ribosomal protein L11 methyltransferase
MSGAASLRVVTATVPREAAEALLDALAGLGWGAAVWEDLEKATCRIEIFLEAGAAAATARDALTATGAALGLALRPSLRRLARRDWTESWKRFFHVSRVSRRVVVRPPWETYAARPGECVIELDPGMSFGTGKHGTTRACLRFLDALAARDAARDVLDIGCGSGILAIGARKLGFRRVAGFDIDEDAVRQARANAARNGVRPRLTVDDVAAFTMTADVVVANILAPVLIAHAGRIAAAVRPGARGALLLSGILDEQYPAVRAATTRLGFVEHRSLLLSGWRSGWFRRG